MCLAVVYFPRYVVLRGRDRPNEVLHSDGVGYVSMWSVFASHAVLV